MLYLHIGFHKAGSSTIQTFLRQNAGKLAGRGVAYPLEGLERRIGHHDIAAAVLADQPCPGFEAAAALSLGQDVILSSERFSLCPAERVRDRLKGAPVRILAYRRDMVSGAVSRYAQITKRGASGLDFDAALQAGANLVFRAAETLGPWAEAFGPAAIRIRSATADCLVGGDLCADFASATGLEMAGLEPAGPQNVSPGWRALEVLRAFRLGLVAGPAKAQAQAFVGGRLRRAVTAAEAGLGLADRGAYLAAAQIDALAAIDAADRAALEASGMDVRVSPPELPKPRAFLPEAARIDPGELAAILRETRAGLARRRPA